MTTEAKVLKKRAPLKSEKRAFPLRIEALSRKNALNIRIKEVGTNRNLKAFVYFIA